ncbi:MAG TPA: hypothetical protein VJB57_15285 [Dehalococcoidia bacterium]|nr:hypothetical protein [Dehalococcoidia bacterium]
MSQRYAAPLAVSVVLAVLALIFALRLEIADDLWPVEPTGPLSFTLIGSFFASACVAMLWCLYVRQPGALFGLGLDYLTIFGVIAIFSFDLADGSNAVVVLAVALASGACLLAATMLPALRFPITDARPQPRLVRLSFYGSVVWLVAVGGALLLKVPDVLPWPLSDQLSVIAGSLFLGAGAYLGYSLLRPSWANTGGQLAAFLAYDVVLVYPLFTRIPDVAPKFRDNLLVYSFVIAYSGLLAIYYLFINPETRLFGAKAPATDAPVT